MKKKNNKLNTEYALYIQRIQKNTNYKDNIEMKLSFWGRSQSDTFLVIVVRMKTLLKETDSPVPLFGFYQNNFTAPFAIVHELNMKR